MKPITRTLFLHCAIALLGTFQTSAWQLKQAPLMTDWARQVDPNNPWPEYPRPQMQRATWLNLNGVWQFQAANAGDPLPTGNLAADILVPFPMESAISGVMQHFERAWYRRTFIVPPSWAGQRIILHFEAVDWECEPFLNGMSLGIHRGGYDPFSYDITPYLVGSGPQVLIVRIYDPTDNTGGQTLQPIGKQRLSPRNIWYTACSGIWQTVWLEPVPAVSIADLKLVPDVDNSRLKLTVSISGPAEGVSIRAAAGIGTNEIGVVTGAPDTELSLPIPSPTLWCPTNPFLYDLRVTALNGETSLDAVTSYFGMRKISLGTSGGFVKMLLNDQFVFQFGPLDQGYWPDGIYTPPTDLAMRADLELTKALGFNLVRKHMKVEPARWYYWADKLGLLVWQDMPSMLAEATNSPAGQANFEGELWRMVQTHWNSPSIIVWTVFNEGWAQYDTVRITGKVMGLDPSRLVNCASGWTFFDAGHLHDWHSYPNPSCPQDSTKAVVNGEFGGVGLPIANHVWAPGGGYTNVATGDELAAKFEEFCVQLSDFVQNQGLSAAVYTQLTDVEAELNGLYTYDRKVRKSDLARVQAAVRSSLAQYALTPVAPTSQSAGQIWKYTTATPPTNWAAPDFTDTAWSTGLGGFGTAGTPGAVVRTTWNTPDIWLRRAFNPGSLTAQQVSNLVLTIHHDEDAEVFLNGVLAFSASGWLTSYNHRSMTPQSRAALLPDAINVLAVHCHQNGGGQYIDAGIELRTMTVPPPPPPPPPAWVEDGVGVRGDYFTGMGLANFVFARVDPNINFNWGGGSPSPQIPSDQFSIRWTGQIQPRYSEVYTFYLNTDNGRRLWINNQLIVDKFLDDWGIEYTGTIALTGGQRYSLRLEYFEYGGGASARLEWASASQAREVVPQRVLFLPANSPPALSPLPDRLAGAGIPLTATNRATDPDLPLQTLSFSLISAPAGATINPGTGVILWRPAAVQADATNLFTVRVGDNGAPSLSATQSFWVTVRPLAKPRLDALRLTDGGLALRVSGDYGPDYALQLSTNLSQPAAWVTVFTVNAPTLPFTWPVPPATNVPLRFYRIVLAP